MTKKILVVDDEEPVVTSVKQGLKSLVAGYDVVGVNSGYDCLEKLKNEPLPDLILLDIMMPDMSGWETYDRIKENQKWMDIPIVFLTARSDNVARNAGRFLGEDFIEKPFEINELKNRLERFFKK